MKFGIYITDDSGTFGVRIETCVDTRKLAKGVKEWFKPFEPEEDTPAIGASRYHTIVVRKTGSEE